MKRSATTAALKPRRNRLPRIASWVVSGLMVVAAGGVVWFGTSRGGGSSPAPAQVTVAASTVSVPAAANPLPLAGGLPTRVVVPSAGIDAAISEVGVVREAGRTAWETAWQAAGHHIDSALPGEPGNMILTGHVSVADRSNVAVFRSLDRVKAGDVVEVYSGSQVFRYGVTDVSVVEASATKVLAGDHRSRVTLITCTKDLKHRLVVNGTLIS